MPRHLIYIVLLLGLSVACVTERVDSSDDGEAYLQREIDAIIKRLPYQAGMELYTDLNHLVAYGRFVVPPMMECLDSPNVKLRASAALVLGQLRAQDALDLLLERANDENPWVRYEAARAVLEIGAWDTVPQLIAGLEDETASTRQLCFDVLERKTGQSFGYDPLGPESERSQAVTEWQSWWSYCESSGTTEENLAAN